MKNTYYSLLFCVLLITSCQNAKNNSFLITNNSVGKLLRSSPVDSLRILFSKDSIVKDTLSINIRSRIKKIKIYEKGGKHLLTLTPNSDSIPKIGNIRVCDPRYVTDKGVGINSTFKDIKNNYVIRKVITSINNVVIILKDSDLYFTIDKDQLPSNLRYASNTNIEPVQIPDTAKIKYMMVGWE